MITPGMPLLLALIVPMAFLNVGAQTTDESLSDYIVSMNATVLRLEGKNMTDVEYEFGQLQGVIVRDSFEIGQDFRAFAISAPTNVSDQVCIF